MTSPATSICSCEKCGLNVPQPTTQYATDGSLLCRNCANQADFAVAIGRAREEARNVGRRGVAGAIARANANAAVSRVEEGSGALFTVMRKADAVSFTCKPCGQTFPLEQGDYGRAGRVLCPPCHAADAAAKPTSACIIASACLGEDADEVARLRKLRDDAISTDPVARDFFHVFWSRYYEWSPGVARVANADPGVADHIRWGFLEPWLAWMEFVTGLGTKELDAIDPAERDAILRRLAERRRVWLEQLPGLFEGKRPKSDAEVYEAFERFRAGAQAAFGAKQP